MLAAIVLDLQALWDGAVADMGSTVPPAQWRALLVIHRFGTPGLNILARELRASTSATSKLCDRLDHAGLVTRTTSATDRRGIVLSLSEAGQRLVRWAEARLRDRLGVVVAEMSPSGRELAHPGAAQPTTDTTGDE